ncbi:restriction endonuclease subunit S domain-containing protein [Streptomyces mangrovi]|uniref:hypothetical protein n=1 Tax=Streptomyces mangrovi TaxID=1206892 RepID=UPI00399C6B35
MHDFVAAIHSERFGPWRETTVGELADELLTYGVHDQGLPDHQGVIRAGDIRDGRVMANPADGVATAVTRRTRAVLREGDLVVVLVRRVGDAALVTGQHAGWIATRSVGIVRAKEPNVTSWLRIWFRTPPAQAWIGRHVSAHVEPTLSLDALKKMRVWVPPREQIDKLCELVALIEAKMDLNRQITAGTVAVADACHASWARHRASWTSCTFGAVARAVTGKSSPGTSSEGGDTDIAWVAPADILGATTPYVGHAEHWGPAEPNAVCEPGTLLVASRPEGARTAITLVPSAPRRGVLAVRPTAPEDRWWLLHELRSRSDEIPKIAQGRSAREITGRAFARLGVAWPGPDVRRRFRAVAEPLHARARAALDENRTLAELLDVLLHGVSSGTRRS